MVQNGPEWSTLLVCQKKFRWTSRGRTWSSPPSSARTSSILIDAPFSKCQGMTQKSWGPTTQPITPTKPTKTHPPFGQSIRSTWTIPWAWFYFDIDKLLINWKVFVNCVQTLCTHKHISTFINTSKLLVFLVKLNTGMPPPFRSFIYFRPKRMQVFIIFSGTYGKLSIKIQRILLVLSGTKQTWRVCRLPQIW